MKRRGPHRITTSCVLGPAKKQGETDQLRLLCRVVALRLHRLGQIWVAPILGCRNRDGIGWQGCVDNRGLLCTALREGQEKVFMRWQFFVFPFGKHVRLAEKTAETWRLHHDSTTLPRRFPGFPSLLTIMVCHQGKNQEVGLAQMTGESGSILGSLSSGRIIPRCMVLHLPVYTLSACVL